MEKLECLMCREDRPRSGIVAHIRSHLHYNRYKCTKCEFSCDGEDEAFDHSCNTQHVVAFEPKSYYECLVKRIFCDFRDADKKKAEALAAKLEKYEGVEDRVVESEDRQTITGIDMYCGMEQQVDSSQKTQQKVGAKVEEEREESENSVQYVFELLESSQSHHNRQKKASETGCVTEISVDSASNVADAVGDNSRKTFDVVGDLIANSEISGITKAATKLPYIKNVRSSYKNRKPESRARSRKLGGKNAILADEKTVQPVNIEKKNPVISGNEDLSVAGNRDESHEAVGSKDEVIPSDVPMDETLDDGSSLTTPCRKCGKAVGVSYCSRKSHALKYHFAEKDDPEIHEILPATVQACFPSFIASSDLQCTECGKEFTNEAGRRNHVSKHHMCWTANCPIRGCTIVFTTFKDLKRHLKTDHELHNNDIAKHKRLQCRLRKLESKENYEFSRLLLRCFPCALPTKCKGIARDFTGLPRASLTSVIASLLRPPKSPAPARSKLCSDSSSSDSDPQSSADEENEGTKMNKKLEAAGADRGTTDVLSPGVMQCKLCNEKISLVNGVKQLKPESETLEAHAWRHFLAFNQRLHEPPFSCDYCEFMTYTIPEMLKHETDAHRGRAPSYRTNISREMLKPFLDNFRLCFPSESSVCNDKTKV